MRGFLVLIWIACVLCNQDVLGGVLSRDATEPAMPAFVQAYLSKAKQQQLAAPSKKLPLEQIALDDDEDQLAAEEQALDYKRHYLRMDVEVMGKQRKTFSRQDEMALIESVASQTPEEKMDEVDIKHVAEWNDPKRVVVELEVKAVTPQRRAELLKFFRTDDFRKIAARSFAENTNSKMVVMFSNPRAKGAPTAPLTESQTVMYSVFGALLAALVAAFFMKVCQQFTMKKVHDDLGLKRKHRSLATNPADDEDAGEVLI